MCYCGSTETRVHFYIKPIVKLRSMNQSTVNVLIIFLFPFSLWTFKVRISTEISRIPASPRDTIDRTSFIAGNDLSTGTATTEILLYFISRFIGGRLAGGFLFFFLSSSYHWSYFVQLNVPNRTNGIIDRVRWKLYFCKVWIDKTKLCPAAVNANGRCTHRLLH